MDGKNVDEEGLYREVELLRARVAELEKEAKSEASISGPQHDLLVQERKQYHDFLDNLNAGVVAHAPDTSILFCNRRALEILGLSMDQMMGKTAMDPQWRFVHANGSDMAPDDYPIGRILKNQTMLEDYVLGIVGANDRPATWVICNGLPVMNTEGSLDHILISFFDITERKQAVDREMALNENLARAKRMESLGLLAGGVAHDLNNMLGPMLGLPDLIKEDLELLLTPGETGAQEVMESLDVIKVSAERAAKVVQNLVGLSRSGHFERVPVRLASLACLVGSDQLLVSLKSEHPLVAISCQFSGENLTVMGGNESLTRITHNLVLNAVQAIDGPGKIAVVTQGVSLTEENQGYEVIPPGEYACLTVEDTGRGISPADMGHIFEPFFSRKTRGERSGSGLGLSVVHGLVKDLGGYVDVNSELGMGAVIDIYLPLVASEMAVEDVSAGPVSWAGTERVLIVDDEAVQRFLASRILQKCGYQTVLADDGAQAVNLIITHALKEEGGSPFDLVVLDMVMDPGFDGLDVFTAIRKAYPDQCVVIASGHAENERVRQAIALGAKWVAKPYSADELLQTVRQVLDAG